MSANIITINGISEFYVGDSKMPAFLKWLAENGFPQNKEAEEILKEAHRIVQPRVLVSCPMGIDKYGCIIETPFPKTISANQ